MSVGLLFLSHDGIVMNYPDLSLSELVCKAISGSQQGIAQIQTTNNHAD